MDSVRTATVKQPEVTFDSANSKLVYLGPMSCDVTVTSA